MKKRLLSLCGSFLSPCGRVGVAAYWKRQLLLFVLTGFCTFPNLMNALQMFGEDSLWLKALYAPALLGQGNPFLLGVTLAATDQAQLLHRMAEAANNSPTGWEPGPGLAFIGLLLLALLVGWSSFALLLRRLRDTRVGLWALPFCLPLLGLALLSLATIYAVPDDDTEAYLSAIDVFATLMPIPFLLPLILTSLPGRKEKQTAETVTKPREAGEAMTSFTMVNEGGMLPARPVLEFRNGLTATRSAGHPADILLSRGGDTLLRARNRSGWQDRLFSRERFSISAPGIQGELTLHALRRLELNYTTADGSHHALSLPLLKGWRERLFFWELPELGCSVSVERSVFPKGGSVAHSGELGILAAFIACVLWECRYRSMNDRSNALAPTDHEC